MRSDLQAVFQQISLVGESADKLARLVVAPPAGLFDLEELSEAGETRLALLAALVAAADQRQFSGALKPLLDFATSRMNALTPYDCGRLWHLKGFAAWRLDQSIFTANHALNRSISLLEQANSPEASAYLARVSDTLAQFLQYQGLLHDARAEFERALIYREAIRDEIGKAITLGGLGRLCMDIGDFKAAAKHLSEDLSIVRRLTPGMGHLQSQLLSHLGTCALHLNRVDEAHDYFWRSEERAQRDGNELGLAFAVLGQGNLALRAGELANAQAEAVEAARHIEHAKAPEGLRHGVRGFIHQLTAEINLAKGEGLRALEEFAAAEQHFNSATNVSPIEWAQLLRAHARAAHASGMLDQSYALLRRALAYLDPTSAEALRQGIEQELQSRSRDSWLLHSAGRFVGQRQIEVLLEEAGHGGFRGEKKELVILFSDIRGFTNLSLQLQPDELIVFLNDYLSHMARCVEHFGGMVDKFIGDAVMALFSLPETKPDDAERAILAALMMRTELERFNRNLPDRTKPLSIGLGLHFGPVVAGLIGSPQKRSYTVIGDPVNTASRLEGMTKTLGASLLVSQELVARLPRPTRFLLRPLGAYRPKGRAQAVTVFDVIGEDDGSHLADEIKLETETAQMALNSLAQRRFADALGKFGKLLEFAQGTNRAAAYQLLTEQAHEWLKKPPPDTWDGAITLHEK